MIASTPGLTRCQRHGAMSGLYAYFRSDREARRHSRRDGLHRFFGHADVRQSSSRPVPMGEPESGDDVVMEVSSNTTSDHEAEQPNKFRRSLPPGGSELAAVPQHRQAEFRVGSFSLPVMKLGRCGPLEHAAETMARSCFEQGTVTWMQLEAIMNAVPEDTKIRWKQTEPTEQASPKSFMTGAWARGPQTASLDIFALFHMSVACWPASYMGWTQTSVSVRARWRAMYAPSRIVIATMLMEAGTW